MTNESNKFSPPQINYICMPIPLFFHLVFFLQFACEMLIDVWREYDSVIEGYNGSNMAMIFQQKTYRYAARGFAYATHGMSSDSPIFVVICMSLSFKIGGTGSRIPVENESKQNWV